MANLQEICKNEKTALHEKSEKNSHKKDEGSEIASREAGFYPQQLHKGNTNRQTFLRGIFFHQFKMSRRLHL